MTSDPNMIPASGNDDNAHLPGSGRRVLILTAGFGEGHNAAARGIAKALEIEAPACDVRLLDPLDEERPRTNALAKKLYLLTIHRTPRLWQQLYTLSDKTSDPSRDPLFVLRKPKKLIAKTLSEFLPDTVICTYPLYPHMLRRAGLYTEGEENSFKLITVITDSVTINKVWLRAPADAYLVTDLLSAQKIETGGMPAEKVHAFGFPVNPSFADKLEDYAGEQTDNPSPFRIALFPTGAKNHMRAILEQLSKISPLLDWRVTLVLGKHEESLRPVVDSGLQTHGIADRVEVLGWTDQVPRILATHHLLCAKAGGATVHEARAAGCPMLIHYIVPGQEEGNAILLENEGGGSCLASYSALAQCIEDLAADNFAKWRKQRDAMRAIATPHAARNIARWLIFGEPAPTQ